MNNPELHEIVLYKLNTVYSFANVDPGEKKLDEWLDQLTPPDFWKLDESITDGTSWHVWNNCFDFKHWYLQTHLGKLIDSYMRVACTPAEFFYYETNFSSAAADPAESPETGQQSPADPLAGSAAADPAGSPETGQQSPADPLTGSAAADPAGSPETGQQSPADPLTGSAAADPAGSQETGQQSPADPLTGSAAADPAGSQETGQQSPTDPLTGSADNQVRMIY